MLMSDEQGAMTRSRSQPRGPQRGSWALAAMHLALWTTTSSALIVMNKRLLVDDGFGFPLALTAGGQMASLLLGLLASAVGLVKLRSAPKPSFYLTRLVPVVVCSAGTLFLGNVAYLHLSVAFIQILKAATPAFTLTVSALVGLERPTRPLLAAVGLIVAGTAAAAIVESGGAAFSGFGLACFVASAALEAGRVVTMQLLLGSLEWGAVEMLVFLGPPTAALLGGASLVFERAGLADRGLARLAARPGAYLAAVAMGFAVNVTTAKAIQATGGLTFKVVGCIKNAGVVAAGVLLLGEHVAPSQLAGYAVAMAGFALYSREKLAHSAVSKEKST